jgi:hypothetical protein
MAFRCYNKVILIFAGFRMDTNYMNRPFWIVVVSISDNKRSMGYVKCRYAAGIIDNDGIGTHTAKFAFNDTVVDIIRLPFCC